MAEPYPKNEKYQLHYSYGYQADSITENGEKLKLREVVELLNTKEEIIELLSDLIVSSIKRDNSNDCISKSDLLKYMELKKRHEYYVARYESRAEAERKWAIQNFMKAFLDENEIDNEFVPQKSKR